MRWLRISWRLICVPVRRSNFFVKVSLLKKTNNTSELTWYCLVRAKLGPDDGDSNVSKLQEILRGEKWVAINLQFLHSNDNTDLAILNAIKDSVPAKDTVCHAATIMCNALMHAGTKQDRFLRLNLEWLARATHWARFTAAAGLGVIHKGNLSEGQRLLAPYLPNAGGANPSTYSEGGALYGLGIIHANHGHTVQVRIGVHIVNVVLGCSCFY
jgi:hypothetical protein